MQEKWNPDGTAAGTVGGAAVFLGKHSYVQWRAMRPQRECNIFIGGTGRNRIGTGGTLRANWKTIQGNRAEPRPEPGVFLWTLIGDNINYCGRPLLFLKF